MARPFHAQSMLPRKELVTISVIYLAASRDRLRGSHVTCSIPFIQRRSPKIVMRISKTSTPVNVAATDHGDSSDIIAIKRRPGAPMYLYFALIMPTRFVRWRKYSRGTFNISAPMHSADAHVRAIWHFADRETRISRHSYVFTASLTFAKNKTLTFLDKGHSATMRIDDVTDWQRRCFFRTIRVASVTMSHYAQMLAFDTNVAA